MENELFLATVLGCGVNDLRYFLYELDLHEDNVFSNDNDFSYQKLRQRAKEISSDININTLFVALDELVFESAFEQIEAREDFIKCVQENFSGTYNYSDHDIQFRNIDELKSFDEWEEFSELILFDE